MNETESSENVWVISLILAVLTLDVIFWAPFCEDAYITLRYSRNFVDGHGFGVWNIGESPVEGFTSILWMLLMAFIKRVGMEMVDGAKVIGILSHIGIVASVFYIPKWSNTKKTVVRFFEKIKYPVSLLSTLFAPVIWYSSYGLETVLFTFLVTVIVWASYLLNNIYTEGLFVGLAILCRPESLFVVLLAYFFAAMYFWLEDESAYKTKINVILFTLIIYISLLIFRHQYFGSILPNTYYAKVDGSFFFHLEHGIKYLGKWALNNIILFGASIYTILVSIRKIFEKGYREIFRPPIPHVLIFCVYCVYIIRVGGDTAPFPMGRHMVHQLPFLAIVVTVPILHLSDFLELKRGIAVTLAVLLLSNAQLALKENLQEHLVAGVVNFPHLESYHPSHTDRKDAFIRWLDDLAVTDSKIAIASAGKTSFELDDVDILDVLGLNTEEVARNGTYNRSGPIDSKTNMDWIISRNPDVIILPINANKLFEGQPLPKILWSGRDEMVLTSVRNNTFCKNYELVTNAPYNSYNRPVFIHKSYIDDSPVHVNTAPLHETVLCKKSNKNSTKN